MLMRIVPKLTATAGMKRDSVGWRKEALKVCGKHQKRVIIIAQMMM